MIDEGKAGQESPFACDMTAIEPGERGRHAATTGELFQAVEAVRELPNGYAFRLPNKADVLVKAAEFISLERLCCPFFGFTMEVEAEGGPLWLSLTGRDGVKPFIRAEVGVHWIFDAFDFTEGKDGSLHPSTGNERIGGVGLGLRIARDVFMHGNNGQGPQMTPNSVNPPIPTPPAAPSQPMPTRPAQPAEVGGCAGPAVDPLQAKPQETKSSKKGAAKGSAKKGAAKKGASKKGAAQDAAAADVPEQEQDSWPYGISEQDEAPPAVQGAWPSGISEK